MDGSVKGVAVADQAEKSPDEVVETITAQFQEQAQSGAIRAAGVCINTRVDLEGRGRMTDAICIRVEHAEGEAIQAFVPYRRGLFGKYKFGEIVAERGERRIWNGDEFADA
jgi:hypothetical protein